MREEVPQKPSLAGLEDKWGRVWQEAGTYEFDRSRSRAEVFSIDTPPPTVSGSLHIGHVFSYTHADVIARYKRMRGMEVFYPIGWDDNGVPTERRVENYYGVRCDPNLAESPGFEPPEAPGERPIPVSRPDFVRLCHRLTSADEAAFEQLWRRVGLSVDWSITYTTIGERSRRASQRAFLRLLEAGQVYSAEAPTLWDVDFQTAVSQAELEDRPVGGSWHRIAFHRPGAGEPVVVETTRPELLMSCVALVAHPDDRRYADLFGSDVTTPLFGVRVPVLAHPLAEPDKGTGIAMVCTFGDTTDVTWWRELDLPLRAVIGRDGRFGAVEWGTGAWQSDDVPAATAASATLAGKSAHGARAEMVRMLAESGHLLEAPRPLTHAVKFYEKGRRPLEIVTSRQWFLRLLDNREALSDRGRQLEWFPAFMQGRYESWVGGLASDWNLSRQRYFGVPFPVWYRLDEAGEPCFDRVLLPSEGRLPVDPSTDAPDGFDPSRRGRPGGFVGDPDVMDTWATSSLTPQLAGGWEEDPDLFGRVFPMDLRPQGQDIIRTWLFYTVVRSELESHCLPWRSALISGFIVDPDRKKMSKSKGNVVTPSALLEEHGSDAVRYWAASGRPGADTVADPAKMKVGRRLAIKLLNASRFAINLTSERDTEAVALREAAGSGVGAAVSEPIDRAMLAVLAQVVSEATAALEGYDYTRALERTESFFWSFCDDYLELVKARAYGDESAPAPDASGLAARASARTALLTALSVVCRLLAPVMPFVTEEVWSWWREGSVHRAPWPDAGLLADRHVDRDHGVGDGADPAVWQFTSEVLAQVRRAKTAARLSMRAEVRRVLVRDRPDRLAALMQARGDLLDAGSIAEMHTEELGPGEDASVEVELA
ncbi:MAG: valine--tRNA ligase [Actinomycetota bacterium]|nr:valine--tRNA ligase [Actinomycetota bacterium]